MKEETVNRSTTNGIRDRLETSERFASGPGLRPSQSFEKIEVPESERLPFRFDRHSMEEFPDLSVVFQIMDGQGTPFQDIEVRDLSSSGLSFLVGNPSPWREGQQIERLLLRFDEWTAYDGRATVRSVRSGAGTDIVGVGLTDYLLNIDEILRMQQVKRAQQTARENIRHKTLGWMIPGHAEFKAKLTEFMLFLDAAREEMNRLEKELSWDEIHGTTPNAARDALFRGIDEGFATEWNRWLIELNELYQSDPQHRSSEMACFTRRLLHPYVLAAPFMDRAYHKPLNYPGDYLLMKYIYENRFEGSTLFAKAVHRGAANTAGAEAVRGRKKLLVEKMKETYNRHREMGRPLRIASIASGPAQELCEFLESQEFDVPVHILLFEQEKQALAFSNRNLMEILTRRGLSKVSIISMRDSIRSLFQPGRSLLDENAPYDFIYAAGLFDYLKDHYAIPLTRRLWSLLALGGELLIGNFSHRNTTRWGMEGMADWHLIHREPEEVLSFSSTCGEGSRSEILTEPTGVNLFLRCVRVG